MAVLNDILRITQFFSQSGNQAVLVNFYKVTNVFEAVPTEAQVAEAYHKYYANNLIAKFLSTTASYDRTLVDNLTGELGFFGDYVHTDAGGRSGEPLNSFTAIDVKQSVSNRLTRNGRKRLPFTSEAIAVGNTCTIEGGDLAAIRGFYGGSFTLVNPIDFSNMIILDPVIIGRVKVSDNPPVYELDLSKVNGVASANIVGMTSQVSRKP